MKNILVLCTGNSCRSQIAEGFLRKYAQPTQKIYSAGIETHGVNTKAVETMNEIGIDISDHTSNHIDEYKDINFDFIITVCDHAQENCPYFPSNAVRFHHNFPDPAKATGSPQEIQASFRSTRDMIESYVKDFVTRENL